MDLKKLTKRQQEALLDLAMLAMYADGHLSFNEDERVWVFDSPSHRGDERGRLPF